MKQQEQAADLIGRSGHRPQSGRKGVKMNENSMFGEWVASIERGECGFTYIRLFADAPNWVRNEAINRFGKGTVFLPPRQNRLLDSAAA
ncbi:hypothetical protein U5801_07920 [Lamprobacter modestohalophilus]|nr:hypothetical protein [Lamprobacter modestohalophilus]MEA1049733.1 hypothetical protein [Lamprobacter modestohalophilus]